MRGRSEASTIPHLLVAPTGDRDNAVDDEHGSDTDDYDNQGLIYEDGVWMAVDNVHGAASSNYGNGYEEWDSGGADLDPQASYYDLLLRKYQSLRRKIVQAKANGVNQPKGTPTEKSKKTRWPRNKAAWLQIVDKEYPTLSQVVHMNEHTLFSSIERCALYISKSDSISHQKCCWIWTLLALTGDVGTLDSELISKLRELGVQAGRLGERLQHKASRHQDFEDKVDNADDMPSQNGKINDNSEEASTKVTADMTEVREVETSHETLHISVTPTHGEHHKDNLDARTNTSDAEMDISDDEADQTTNIKAMVDVGEFGNTSHTPANQADEELHKHNLDGTPSKAEPLSNGKEGKVEDKKAESLEEARARLLAQLGDRLVQPKIPLSRAEAERERRLMQEHNGQKMRQKEVIAKDYVAHDVGARSDTSTVSDWNTQTAIDMVLSVVAICYGQRDLLKFRKAW